MSLNIYLRVVQALKHFENTIAFCITGHRPFPPAELCLATSPNISVSKNTKSPSFSLEQLMNDGILWAVPKRRRTVEKRLNRKFGWPEYHWKMLVPRTNLLICNSCGNNFEAGHLCTHCYNKVNEETKLMQKAVDAELGLEPIEKEVVILYKGEKEEQSSSFWEGKRIVEMDKERPQWFSKNLLEKTTQQPSTSKDVKPTELA